MQKNRVFLNYILATLFVLSWWGIGLKGGFTSLSPPPLTAMAPTSESLFISRLTEDLLIEALGGNYGLMQSLISEWDLEAESLGGSRLLLKDRLLAYSLAQSLETNPSPPSGHQIFPHSWAAATLTLALVPDGEIAALPESYIPFKKSAKIAPVSGDPSLFLHTINPTLILAAPYTHPRTLKTFNEYNLAVYIQNPIFSLEDLYQEIHHTAALLNRRREGTLLTLFMKAALLAIDNRAALLPERRSTLLLEKGLVYAAPTEKLLSGLLARRLGLNQSIPDLQSSDWRKPLTPEQIEALKPTHILLLSDGSEIPSDLPYQTTLIDPKKLNLLDPTLILGYLALYEALLP